jgi:hypothetical protein
VPGNFVGADEASLLFYNRESGLAQFYTALGGVDIQEQSSAFWSPGWTHIVAGGAAEFYSTDGSGGIAQLSSTTWSIGWTHILPVLLYEEGYESLLFYNSVSGVSQFYTVDGTGDIHLLSDATTWRKSWALITSIEG